MIDVAPGYLRQYGPTANQHQQILEELSANAMMMRSDMMRQFFDPRRDIDDECGYPRSEGGMGINPDFYRALYEREAVAARVVQLIPKECWQKTPLVYETEDTEDVTPFEEAWDALGQSLRGEKCYYQDEEGSPVWEVLRRADILSGIGHFGVILLGLDDGRMLDQPADGAMSYDPSGQPSDASGKPVGNGWKLTENGAWECPSIELLTRTVHEQRKGVNGKWDGTWNVRHESYVDVSVVSVVPTNNELPATFRESTDWGTKHDPRAPSSQARRSDGTNLSQENPTAPNYGSVGTDAQYAGVQLGPPEFPSDKASTEKRKLIFMRTFDASLVQIVQYEANVANPRFGKPVMYRVTLNDPREQQSGIGLPMATVRVHWSRIIHLADNLGSSEISGVPRMQPVLNRLLDLRKLYSGSAEMYWRGAFPGLSLETVPQLGGDVKINASATRDMMEQYFNGLQRYLLTSGMTAKTLSPQVVDPTQQIGVQIEAICIQLGCPVRVFKGSERGELASAQDDSSWNDRLDERRVNYLTPRVIVPFIDRLIQLGVLPAPTQSKKEGGSVDAKNGNGVVDEGSSGDTEVSPPSPVKDAGPPLRNTYIRNTDGKVTGVKTGAGYSIEWPDLDSLGEKDKAAVALSEAQALTAFAQGGLESIMTPKDFLIHCMKWSEEQADAVLDRAMKAHEDMETMTAPPMIQGQPAAAAPGTQAEADKKVEADQAKQQAELASKGLDIKAQGSPFGGNGKAGGGATAQKNAKAQAKPAPFKR